jgi:tRNA U34 5-carboxymethylaminomethyl modifying GTPase MnmE/TrmE
MRIARVLAGCAMIATLVLLSSDGVLSQEKKDKAGKITGQLPQGWKDLNLSASQKEEVYKINAETKEKVDKLEAEIKKIRDEQSKKRLAVLNDEQRKKLRDTVGGDEPKDKPKDSDKPKE